MHSPDSSQSRASRRDTCMMIRSDSSQSPSTESLPARVVLVVGLDVLTMIV